MGKFLLVGEGGVSGVGNVRSQMTDTPPAIADLGGQSIYITSVLDKTVSSEGGEWTIDN